MSNIFAFAETRGGELRRAALEYHEFPTPGKVAIASIDERPLDALRRQRGGPHEVRPHAKEPHPLFARFVRAAEDAGKSIATTFALDAARGVTEVSILAPDHPWLLSTLAGACAATGANIVDAKIFTLASGMALDTFWIQDLEGKPYDGPQRLARLAARVELALSNRLDVRRELDSQKASWPKRDRVFTVEPRVLIDNNASDTFTVIEVNGRDRPGFLHVVTRALTRCSLQIASAHITTYGERAVDVFYVKDLFGLKIVNQDKLKQVAETVEQSIRDFDARFEPAVKAAE